ncbi:E3 ubiquitin-protein ligase TTC3 [Frankliniella fusca]|uniref:E3 ubiquitin-protein ligase TTC3 n=1 Tax=Frankliniella fusca TaxID=407009 RepID=A0AAE1LT34_9NEOP|nr:E3 ubiquitin-protein ligase TTC3 [Frankliniella fusca]
MYRAKRKLLPVLPKTGQEAVDQFRADIIVPLLAECDILIADGTFDYAPDKFVQMYTFHGNKMGHNVRLAYCCLPNKKGATYVAMLEALKNLVREKVGVELVPKRILVDFEDAALAGFRKCFPGIETRACKFHFSQNLMKIYHMVYGHHDRPRVRNGGKNPNPSGVRLERFREPARAGSRHGRPPPAPDRHFGCHSAGQIATFVATRHSSPLSSPNPTFRRQGGRQIATPGKPGLSAKGHHRTIR